MYVLGQCNRKASYNRVNHAGAALKMTGPITTHKERSPEGGMKMQMCFYIPSEHQANPPQPTMESVIIHKKDKMKVAVRSVQVEPQCIHYCTVFLLTHFSNVGQHFTHLYDSMQVHYKLVVSFCVLMLTFNFLLNLHISAPSSYTKLNLMAIQTKK